jgi:hypothetical protein
MSRTLPGAVLAAVLAASLAGCGSSEPETLPVPSGLPSSTAFALVPMTGPGYRVALPDTAVPYQQHLTVRGQPFTVDGFKSSDLAGGYFLVSRVANPGAAPIDLDALVTSSVGAVGGTLQSIRAVRFRGHPGRDIRYQVNLAGADLTFFVLALDVDNSLFELQYALPSKGVTTRPPLFDEVLATLRLR